MVKVTKKKPLTHKKYFYELGLRLFLFGLPLIKGKEIF